MRSKNQTGQEMNAARPLRARFAPWHHLLPPHSLGYLLPPCQPGPRTSGCKSCALGALLFAPLSSLGLSSVFNEATVARREPARRTGRQPWLAMRNACSATHGSSLAAPCMDRPAHRGDESLAARARHAGLALRGLRARRLRPAAPETSSCPSRSEPAVASPSPRLVRHPPAATSLNISCIAPGRRRHRCGPSSSSVEAAHRHVAWQGDASAKARVTSLPTYPAHARRVGTTIGTAAEGLALESRISHVSTRWTARARRARFESRPSQTHFADTACTPIGAFACNFGPQARRSYEARARFPYLFFFCPGHGCGPPRPC